MSAPTPYEECPGCRVALCCGHCGEPIPRRSDLLNEVAEAARNVVAQWHGDISRKPHIGQLRGALARLDLERAP